MKYVGMQTQIARNNRLSALLLAMFPAIILAVVWAVLATVDYLGGGYYDPYGNIVRQLDAAAVWAEFVRTVPWVLGIVAVWFMIAYWGNQAMVKAATNSRSLSRRECPRVYNIVENLCMSCGMNMPKIDVVDDEGLNAFASGINEKTYTVTVTSGLLRLLDDDELAGVIGHELTHIRNRDTRLLITSIVFVGIISTVMSVVGNMVYRSFIFGMMGSSRDEKNNNGVSVALGMVIVLVFTSIAYVFTLLTRFAISRRREYMADAGGAELCGNPLALASALRKISGDPGLAGVDRSDIAQMYIIHPQALAGGAMNMLNSLFSTHPSTESRIRFLEQF